MSLINSRQHGYPLIVQNDSPLRLNRVNIEGKGENRFNEDWLQDLLFEHPNLLPVNEIEPAFSPLVPICRELPIGGGFLDILYCNDRGMLTLVECKLWRNPEARREVVGQILDYAKEISQWSYEDLSKALLKKINTKSLYQVISGNNPDVDEVEFVDSISRNLKNGRFLLLIVGDGIREGVENIANFLQKHANLNFTFSLIEEAVYELPNSLGGGFLVQPRTIARTEIIERGVVRLEHSSLVIEEPANQVVSHKSSGRRTNITEQEFLEAIREVDPNSANKLPSFLSNCTEIGLTISPKPSSIVLNWESEEGLTFNFGTLFKNGTVKHNYFAGKAEEMGRLDIGEDYLQKVASLFENGRVIKNKAPWLWHVKTMVNFQS